MYCGNCGNKLNEGDRFCKNCGFDNKPNEKKDEVKDEVTPSNNQTPTPVNNNVQKDETPVLGIIALVSTFLFWPAGLILGIVAIVKGKENKGNRILGIVSTVLSTLSFLLFIIIFSVVISTFDTIKNDIDRYEDKYDDVIDKFDNYDEDEYLTDIEKVMRGRWTCEVTNGTNNYTFNFKEDNDFEASNGIDNITGNYYAYEDYSDKNKAKVYMYYDDDDNYTSTKAEFKRMTDRKATITLEDQILNCTK